MASHGLQEIRDAIAAWLRAREPGCAHRGAPAARARAARGGAARRARRERTRGGARGEAGEQLNARGGGGQAIGRRVMGRRAAAPSDRKRRSASRRSAAADSEGVRERGQSVSEALAVIAIDDATPTRGRRYGSLLDRASLSRSVASPRSAKRFPVRPLHRFVASIRRWATLTHSCLDARVHEPSKSPRHRWSRAGTTACARQIARIVLGRDYLPCPFVQRSHSRWPCAFTRHECNS